AGKPQVDAIVRTAIPLWMYIVGGVLVLLIILLIILLVRKNKKAEEEIIIEEEMELVATEIPELPDEDTGEAATKRKQLEKLAREKPEDFSKLIRTWLSED
ncbi:MAG TPA: flagellar M-ring protein FliF, partial [Bacilli bacterium]|nr:flagellar M-ring protein FliF [Bacilli bacterium]